MILIPSREDARVLGPKKEPAHAEHLLLLWGLCRERGRGGEQKQASEREALPHDRAAGQVFAASATRPQTSGLTACVGFWRWASASTSPVAAMTPIFVRVSSEALARWGTMTAFGSAASPGTIFGSNS